MSGSTYMALLASAYKAALTRKLGSVGKDKFDCYIDGGTLLSSFKDMGDGMIVARFNYKAVFEFEALPSALMDPRILMAITTCWLLENDKDRKQQNLKGPVIEVDAYATDNQGSLSDMTIEIEFSEPITMQKVAEGEGDIQYQGEQWNIAPFVVHVAESGEVLSRER